MVALIQFEIPATPHTCLRPNDTSHPIKKNTERQTLKDAAWKALNNVLVVDEAIARLLANHRLQLVYEINWQSGRKKVDPDALGHILKGATDGIAGVINHHRPSDLPEVNDRDFAFVFRDQQFPEERQGWITVEIVSLGEIERTPEPVSLTWRCQAITKKGTQCTRRGIQEFQHDDMPVHVCGLHLHVLAAGGAFEFEMEAVAA